jgi:hypothetical protein
MDASKLATRGALSGFMVDTSTNVTAPPGSAGGV